MERKKLVLFVVLVLACVLGGCIFTGAINTPLTDPLTNFQAPKYIPEGYVNVENNSTTDIDKSFTFANEKYNNYFIVAAVKDLKKSEYAELIEESSKNEEVEGVEIVKEDIAVDGHPTTLKILTTDFMGIALSMFHVTWVCPQSGLHIIAIGKINNNETEPIKKMVTSIQCHQNQKWITNLKKIIQ